ncbi:hypothetical protein IWX47DRAFT_626571 [Phyllosticta citricarpa]
MRAQRVQTSGPFRPPFVLALADWLPFSFARAKKKKKKKKKVRRRAATSSGPDPQCHSSLAPAPPTESTKSNFQQVVLLRFAAAVRFHTWTLWMVAVPVEGRYLRTLTDCSSRSLRLRLLSPAIWLFRRPSGDPNFFVGRGPLVSVSHHYLLASQFGAPDSRWHGKGGLLVQPEVAQQQQQQR